MLGVFILGMIIKPIFFTKMEFIQSKIYSNLYLVKNPIKDRDSLHKVINELVLQQLVGNEEKYKYSGKNETGLNFHINIYEYCDGWGTAPFGGAGTAFFIENEEDSDGMITELLQDYNKYHIARFDLIFCENENANNYFGKLSYFQDGNKISTDTIINLCQK